GGWVAGQRAAEGPVRGRERGPRGVRQIDRRSRKPAADPREDEEGAQPAGHAEQEHHDRGLEGELERGLRSGQGRIVVERERRGRGGDRAGDGRGDGHGGYGGRRGGG